MKTANILVVEGECIIADILRQYFEKEQLGVTVINNGRTVVNFVRSKQVDLILLDIGLPDKDGITIYREMRAFSEVPVIFLIEKIEDVDRLLGLKIDKGAIIQKPFIPKEVVAKVKAIITGKQPFKKYKKNTPPL